MSTWEVVFEIESAIKIARSQTIKNIKLKHIDGNLISATLKVEANDSENALNKAIRNVNDVLDTLSLITNSPMQIKSQKSITQLGSSTHQQYIQGNSYIIRICSPIELSNSEKILNKITPDKTTYLRALGWYRKGLNGTDPFDIFLAFWNSIEVTTEKYGDPTITSGSKDRMIPFLNEYLGGDQKFFVREFYKYRKNIAHGIKEVSHDQIMLVTSKIPKLKEIANRFLNEFAKRKYLSENNLEN